MPFISSAILRIRSRICLRRVTLSSLENKMGGGVDGVKGRRSGTIQISKAASNETTLAETHQRK